MYTKYTWPYIHQSHFRVPVICLKIGTMYRIWPLTHQDHFWIIQCICLNYWHRNEWNYIEQNWWNLIWDDWILYTLDASILSTLWYHTVHYNPEIVNRIRKSGKRKFVPLVDMHMLCTCLVTSILNPSSSVWGHSVHLFEIRPVTRKLAISL